MRILYLDLDTLRPDHLGCYGYSRNTSPNIDSIAADGVRFNNYYCTDAPCLPSRNALMTGKYGIHTGVVGHGGTAADMRLEGAPRDFQDMQAANNLPSVLRSKGLKTVLISPFAERHSSWNFYAGFNEMHNTGKCGGESAEDVTPTVMDWLERNADKDNWYLHVNYWDAHTPYRAPLDYGNPFADSPAPDWITQDVLDKHLQHVGPHSAHEISMYDNKTSPQFPRHLGEIKNLDDVKEFYDGYDCGINYMDSHIGGLLNYLKSIGIYDDLCIIISADHGENMGELGLYGEHGTADNITCRIPMIIKWDGVNKGSADNGLHYNIDLLPTLADLLGVKQHPAWDGQSYADTLLNGLDTGRDYLVVSQCAHVCQRGVRFGDYMYVRTYHDGYHLFPDDMLFNIANDPHEQYNLAESHPELCREAVYLLNRWHDKMMLSMDCDIDPLWTVIREGGPYHARGHLKNYIEWLKITGRGHAESELITRHPNEI